MEKTSNVEGTSNPNLMHFSNPANPDEPQVAYRFSEDGEGLCYYPDGKVALAVSNLSNGYSKRFYVYDNDKEKTLLSSINELAVGFAFNNCKTSSARNSRLVLTNKGGVLSNKDGNITSNWKWDRGAQNAGMVPAGGVNMPLNAFMNISFEDRFTIVINYEMEGIRKSFDAGLKLKRMDSYLDAATRTGLGRLDVTLKNYRSLKEGQTDFAETMTALRNKNNPRSENLTDMVAPIVSDLETHFDTYVEDKRGTKSLRLGNARTDARKMTEKELPKIKRTQQDIKVTSGYSETLYLSEKEAEGYKFDARNTARPLLLKPNGTWKSDVEIRIALMKEEHPPLEKPTHIKRSNGHYTYNHAARDIVPRPEGQPTLRKSSTVKEAPELQDLLGSRLGSMKDDIMKLYNR